MPVAAGAVGVRVQLEAARVDDRLAQAAFAPGNRADAGGQLAERERLHEVVVGALVQPFDALADRAAGGEHDDAAAEAVLAQAAADFDAINAWKVQVQADDVVVVDACLLEGFRAVLGDINGIAELDQAALDRAGDWLFIFDNQDSHGVCLTFLRCHLYPLIASLETKVKSLLCDAADTPRH